MKLFAEVTEVKLAQARVRVAREQLGRPVTAIFERSDRHPLSTVGIAAGVGFALGSLNLHPLRTPGVGPLLGGGLADAAAFATRWLVEQGLDGFGGHAKRTADHRAADDMDDADTADGAASAGKTPMRESAPTS
ncbi:MAG: hypothetical protein ABI114_04030 [Rhodanobacter sp.]